MPTLDDMTQTHPIECGRYQFNANRHTRWIFFPSISHLQLTDEHDSKQMNYIKKKIELKNFELLRPGVCMGCQWSSISSVLTFNYRCGAVCFCFIRVSIFEKYINHLAIFAHSRCKNSSVERAERGNVRLKCVVSCF